MKLFILTSLLLFSGEGMAGSIWIQSSDSNRQEFGNFLRHQTDAQTYAQFQLSKLIPQDIPSGTLQWAQSTLELTTVPANFALELDSIESQGMMDSNYRTFLRGFLQKLREKAAGNKQVSKALCKWNSFPGDSHSQVDCAGRPQSLGWIASKFPWADGLLLEDQMVSMSAQSSLTIDPNEVYNWRILSNSKKMISFRGSLQDFRNQDFRPENLVSGDCKSFTQKLDDMEVVSNGSVFFNETCQRSLREPETSGAKEWLSENRSWVVPVGIAVLGAIAYQYKDKKLVIEKPAFSR